MKNLKIFALNLKIVKEMLKYRVKKVQKYYVKYCAKKVKTWH